MMLLRNGYWWVVLMVLSGCSRELEGEFLRGVFEILLAILVLGLLAAGIVLVVLLVSGGFVFIGAYLATYTHLHPTPTRRVVSGVLGVPLILIGTILLLLGAASYRTDLPPSSPIAAPADPAMSAPPAIPEIDNRAPTGFLFVGMVSVALGLWNLLAALGIFRWVFGAVPEEDLKPLVRGLKRSELNDVF